MHRHGMLLYCLIAVCAFSQTISGTFAQTCATIPKDDGTSCSILEAKCKDQGFGDLLSADTTEEGGSYSCDDCVDGKVEGNGGTKNEGADQFDKELYVAGVCGVIVFLYLLSWTIQ